MTELHPPTRSFAELRERIGLSEEEIAEAQAAVGEPYMPHADWEAQHPEYLEHARSQEDARRERWVSWHGTEEGFVPGREFPCPGMLRVEDPDAKLWAACCDRCGFEVGVPIVKLDPDRLVAYRLERAHIPEAFTLKQFDPAPENEQTLGVCRAWIRDFPRGPLPAPAIWGGVGRGKSHLLSLIARTLIENHQADVLFVSAVDLLENLQQGLDAGDLQERRRRALNAAVLVLDDLGAERKTEWRSEQIAALVDYRHLNGLPIVLATNIPPDRWAGRYDERTASRLAGMTLRLRLLGEDRRGMQGVQQKLGEDVAA